MNYCTALDNDLVKCNLCPRFCVITSGHFGSCGVRGNKGGKGILPYWGYVTALAMDPIEKKPLYHFRPGSMILSAGFTGCNLRCPFCQNWSISQSVADAPGNKMSSGDIVSAALHNNSHAIAYTYSEPLVHAEFLLDSMALAHRHGMANVLVTNGCVNAEAAAEILSFADAANIDLKCFSAQTYNRVLGGISSGIDGSVTILETVLGFIRLAFEMGVHIEITTLVVPGLNDSVEELDACADFIESLSADIPWHLSAYHPDYRWNAPPTDPAFLARVQERAGKKLCHVYAGNISGEENNTFCPHCRALLVRRRGYRIDALGIAAPAEGERLHQCAQCGRNTTIVY